MLLADILPQKAPASGFPKAGVCAPCLSYFVLIISSHRKNTPVGSRADLDAGLGCAGMDDTSAADVDPHMAAIVNDISGLGFGIADRLTGMSLGVRLPGNGNAKILVHRPGKAGAVRAVGQAGAAGHIGIPHKL